MEMEGYGMVEDNNGGPLSERHHYTLPDTSSSSVPEVLSPPRVIPYVPLPGVNVILGGEFVSQPPENLRKCSFFNFSIVLLSANKEPIQIESAHFLTFIEVTEEDRKLRNGVVYRVGLILSGGEIKKEDIFIRLIDSSSKMPIAYEGTSKSPDLQRVLLTHVLICSRCCQKKSCGNKNETPSDPVIHNKNTLKIFLKCNQNCLKNAGNPSRTRRFQLALYNSPETTASPLAISDCMFVHNNSKHGKKFDNGMQTLPALPHLPPQHSPVIHAICPNEGWVSGGELICIVGENFIKGLQVIFGSASVQADYLTPNAMSVRVPPRGVPGEVKVTLAFEGTHYCSEAPGQFIYLSPVGSPSLTQEVSRLARIVKASKNQPINEILGRAADLLEAASTSGQVPGVSASSQMFQFPRSPYLPAYSLSIPPIVTTCNNSTRMELSGSSSSPPLHKPLTSISSATSNDSYMTPGMESLSTGVIQPGPRPLSCSISDDGKSTHSTSCGSITPVSRCGSSDGLRHTHGPAQDHSNSSVTPSQTLAGLRSHSPSHQIIHREHMPTPCSNTTNMEYASAKPVPFLSSNAWSNSQIQMCFPQGFGVIPSNTSIAPHPMQIGSIPTFQGVGVSLSNQVSASQEYVQAGPDLSTLGHCKPPTYNMMACMQNTNNNNMSAELSGGGGGTQNSDDNVQQTPTAPIIQQVAMFPLAATSPHINTMPALPPQSPGLYILPGTHGPSLPVTPTGLAPIGFLSSARPVPVSPFPLQSSSFMFPNTAQQPTTSAQQESSEIYNLGPPGVRKRKVSEMDYSDIRQ